MDRSRCSYFLAVRPVLSQSTSWVLVVLLISMFQCYLSPLQFLSSKADCAIENQWDLNHDEMDKEHYTSFFLRPFSSFFSFFVCCLFSLFPLFLMLSGGDMRPLALVVIGRGQITTPYILVIPSEGDYCFRGRIFSSLCYIFHQSTTINTTQTLFHFGCPLP